MKKKKKYRTAVKQLQYTSLSASVGPNDSVSRDDVNTGVFSTVSSSQGLTPPNRTNHPHRPPNFTCVFTLVYPTVPRAASLLPLLRSSCHFREPGVSALSKAVFVCFKLTHLKKIRPLGVNSYSEDPSGSTYRDWKDVMKLVCHFLFVEFRGHALNLSGSAP